MANAELRSAVDQRTKRATSLLDVADLRKQYDESLLVFHSSVGLLPPLVKRQLTSVLA